MNRSRLPPAQAGRPDRVGDLDQLFYLVLYFYISMQPRWEVVAASIVERESPGGIHEVALDEDSRVIEPLE